MLEMGGAQQNTLYTCRHLDRERYDPLLICGPGGLLDADAAAAGGPAVRTIFVRWLVRPIRPLHDLFAIIALWRILRREKPDIVHTHSSKAGILGRLAAWFARVPRIIHTYHGFGFNDEQKPWVRFAFVMAERFVAPISDRLVVVASQNVEKALVHGIGRRNQYVVIHSGIKVADFQGPAADPARAGAGEASRVRAELGMPPAAPLVGMIGPFKPQKDPCGFITVAATVAAAVPDARFVLIGDGVLRPDVEAAVRRLGLQNRVALPGWRRDIPAVLHALDILVMTSLWEGLPRVFLEAMAVGRPIVATDVDGAQDAVVEGKTGYLVPPRAYDLLAERVMHLLRHPDEARRMGARGRERVSPRFEIDVMVQRLDELYLSVA